RDGGHLLVETDEFDEVMAGPIAAKYVRPFVGSRELLQNKQRWCLWLVDMDQADISKSPVLKKRLEAVQEFRSASTAASTRQMAETPHLFGQRSQPDTHYVCVPRHVSETRRYFTVKLFPPEVIAGDANFKIDDPDGLQFALLSSSMFIAWQKSSRRQNQIRPSVCFDPDLEHLPDTSTRRCHAAKHHEAGQGVLAASDLQPERSLAEHYNPLAMAPELIKAHNE